MIVEVQVSKQLEQLLLSMQDNPTPETREKIQKLSKGLTSWLVDTIKSATVVVDPGIPVSTAGTAVAQTGATTSPGTGRLQ